MLNRFSRTELLLGEENMSKLAQSKIAIFGIGGVGSYVAEGLARCGIGEFILIDSDDISLTNINRQIHALETTIGQKKTLMMKERILAINPQAKVTTIEKLYTPESNFFNWDDDYTYIVDAVDDVKAKINAIPIIPILDAKAVNKVLPLFVLILLKDKFSAVLKFIAVFLILNFLLFLCTFKCYILY